ncbi:MAG: 3-phosphoshikimate 1-carboxyvinyltransferase [Spirochaetales bacterium]|uniref:3-phosphoshikimate 1-carboxyvinyltransferase n=1 Tax=Candidatus Thalassospirochaeta sargassi TaxID=3119039 RepID=A0AAJ1MLJ8_9SPIO|nr:3-phosphoshikimate 1-carboxyvinyltransferase [Spirochaetales bacterium]
MDVRIRGLNGKMLNADSTITVPASKSHTIRALLIASAAEGESRLINPLDSADARSCIDTCRSFGALIDTDGRTDGGLPLWTVTGCGNKLRSTARGDKIITIDVGNSGTSLYLAAGIAALGGRKIRFTGDEQIQRRPVKALLGALSDLGAGVEIEGESPPFNITGPLRGGRTSIKCPTSQYLSSLLICTPLAEGAGETAAESIIDVPLLMEKPYVEMTLRWLDRQGIEYTNNNFKRFTIKGGQSYSAFESIIPGDFSSAAFPLVAAAITGSKLQLAGLDITDSQGDKAVIDYLRIMGCRIDTPADDRGCITIYGPGHPGCPASTLKAAEFDLNDTPDALPAMAVAACNACGTTKLYNVPQARLKETDRIRVMQQELTHLGADIEEIPDGLIIRGTEAGTPGLAPLQGARLNGHDDHRVVMSLALAALTCEGETVISGAEAVDITYPGFFEQLGKLTDEANNENL